MKKQEKMPPGFFLNIQSVYDALEEYYESIRLFKENNNSCLIGVQYYYGQKELDKSYLYLCDGEELERHPFTMKEGYLIVVGECNRSHIVFGCSWIHMKEAQYSASAMRELFNRIQEIFSKNHICEKKINYILNHDGTVEDICALARDYFHNPVFIHDTYYNILAVSEMPENAMRFAYNNRTGKYTQDAETLNNFRVSKEYKKTLLTHGGHIWDSDFDESRCIYVNIWQDGVYRGRFILLELLSSLKTGQLKDAEYFAEAIRILLERRDIKDNEEQHPLKGIVQDALNGKLPDEANLEMQLGLFS
ncbi:MAG: hypothetical protein Q4F21_03290 [Lachnospiraceae bacterium]|nr:hypothetical protein [Lachnospiraceae bacterium]